MGGTSPRERYEDLVSSIRFQLTIPCDVGDIVNIISPVLTPDVAQNTPSPSDTLDLEFSYTAPENFLIAHPDILFPMTSLAGAVGCRRKPLVMDLVKTAGGGYVRCRSFIPFAAGNYD